MGLHVSRGIDNESLMDKLMANECDFPPQLERAIRLVDRGDYFETRNSRTYVDIAWRCGDIHLSAPSIYIAVLKYLDLSSGLHFLNIGSGSGYLSTIAGLILGFNGVNHGIELEVSNIAFANARLAAFLADSDAPLERDFCTPVFMQGNIFDLVIPRPSVDSPVGGSRLATNAGTIASWVFSMEQTGASDDGDQAAEVDDDDSPIASDSGEAHATIGFIDLRNEETVSYDQPMEVPGIQSPTGDVCRQDNSHWNDALPVEMPPLLDWTSQPCVSFNDEVCPARWPTYDRIYVGAAVEDITYLQAILRLLRVGGILVAPVGDELVKITRISEHQMNRISLLPVSFAPLIMPRLGESRPPVYPPLQRQIPTLSRLTSRFIRNRLCRLIEQHHGGPPTLGRLLEVKTGDSSGRGQQPRKKPASDLEGAGTRPADAVKSSRTGHADDPVNDCHTSASDDDDSESDQGWSVGTTGPQRGSESPPRHSGLVRLLHHMLPYIRGLEPLTRDRQPEAAPAGTSSNRARVEAGDGYPCSGSSSTATAAATTEDGDSTGSPSKQPDVNDIPHSLDNCKLFNPNGQALPLSEAEQPGRLTTEKMPAPDDCPGRGSPPPPNEDNQGTDTPGARPHIEAQKHCYRQPSYRYRDEIRRIIVDELHLVESYVRSVLTF